MPRASESTRRVKVVNANWKAGDDGDGDGAGDDGHFQLMLITSDDQQHILEPSPVAVTALVALAQADTVLLWDPENRTLIAANLRGRMPWTERLEGESERRRVQRAAPSGTTGIVAASLHCPFGRHSRTLAHANAVLWLRDSSSDMLAQRTKESPSR